VGTRAVWTGAEILVPTGIRSLERPAISESDLCRLYGIIVNEIEDVKVAFWQGCTNTRWQITRVTECYSISSQRDATVSKFLLWKLYMFRAFLAHHQESLNCIGSRWYNE
jgi:hypothetical protein